MTFPALLAAVDRSTLTLLGGPVTYRTSAGETIEIEGMFDAAYARADADQVGVVSTGPAVFILLEDLVGADGQNVDPLLDPDPTVTVDGVAYSVREVRVDGVGGAVLFLHRAG